MILSRGSNFLTCLALLAAIVSFTSCALIPREVEDDETTTNAATTEVDEESTVTEEISATEEREVLFKGHKLLEAIPMTVEDLKFLRELDETIPEDVLDFWAAPSKVEEPIPILVHPDLLEPVQQAFQEHNLTYSIRVEDFQESIENEIKAIRETDEDSGFTFRDPTNRLLFDLYNYHQLDEINQYISATQNSRGDLGVDFDSHTIGTTHEGKPIQYFSITSKDKSSKRAAIFMDCGIHAREWISPAFCLYVIDRLLDTSELDMTQKFDFYIMPVTNPDGYEYTWGKNRMWRKNRRPSNNFLKFRNARQFWNPYPSGIPQLGGAQYPSSVGGQSQNTKCIGTDPNRNFDIDHTRVGSSGDPCQDTYHGDSAFSEPESRAVRDVINQLVQRYGQERVAAYVSVHAFSQYWMTPHGHTKERPKDYKDHQRVAAAAVSALSRVHQTSYQYGPINEIIYQASGSSVDWAYAKAGVKYSFALELRDQGQSGFMLPVNQIKPTLEETWAGIRGMTDAISKEYPPQ